MSDATAVLAARPAAAWRLRRRRASGFRRKLVDRVAQAVLFVAATFCILITFGIVGTLVYESLGFFRHVSLKDFLTDTEWMPLFAEPRFGILPLVAGTITVTFVALCVALPVGTVCAIWLSEFAAPRLREVVKPLLELLSAVPTVVFGYFALLIVTPALQLLLPELPGFNMLGPGLVIGLMTVPYVASLGEDAMRAVPMALREGAYAMGATRLQVALRVVYPAALSGISAAYVLTFSRALGETMVVAVAAGMQANLTFDPREPAAAITAFIVQVSLGDLPHASLGYQSIFVAGLTLLLMTLVFNVAGYVLRTRFREVY